MMPLSLLLASLDVRKDSLTATTDIFSTTTGKNAAPQLSTRKSVSGGIRLSMDPI